MRPTALLALVILLACGEPAEDTGPAPHPAMSREVFVRHFGPAWCAAMAECLPGLDAAAECANDRSAAIDEFCTDYDRASRRSKTSAPTRCAARSTRSQSPKPAAMRVGGDNGRQNRTDKKIYIVRT